MAIKIKTYVNAVYDMDMGDLFDFAKTCCERDSKTLLIEPFDNWRDGVVVVYSGEGTPDDVKQAFIDEFGDEGDDDE